MQLSPKCKSFPLPARKKYFSFAAIYTLVVIREAGEAPRFFPKISQERKTSMTFLPLEIPYL